MARHPVGHVPLARALSKLAIASRAEAIRLILAGRVTCDGVVVTDLGRVVVPERSVIAVDGVVADRTSRRLIMLHKPRGVVTTRHDPEGRPTVYDLVRGAETHLVPVGRLDLASTGLLLLTNDTKLADWLTDPRTALTRVYIVTVRGLVDEATAARLEEGLMVDGEPLAARRVVVRKRSQRESHLVIDLVEGRNREIRRMLGACDHEVRRLSRVQFGGLELGTLAPGHWREVSEAEIVSLWPGAPRRRG